MRLRSGMLPRPVHRNPAAGYRCGLSDWMVDNFMRKDMILFFDTETTGKADFRRPPEEDGQPRLVQLGAILTDDTGIELASVNLIVQPEGFEVPESAASIHGFTTKIATERGIELMTVLQAFGQLARKAHILCCHNISFDCFVMEGEFIRAQFDENPFAPSDIKYFCTMKEMTDICKIPGPYGNKWPKLQEAFKHAFGKEFEGAHDAMADVRACRNLYFWLKKQLSLGGITPN